MAATAIQNESNKMGIDNDNNNVTVDNNKDDPVNVRLIQIDPKEYLKEKCDDKINRADEKLKANSDKLGLFITVNTFFGGLLLFGINGRRDESYKTGEKNIIQLQIVDFCLFLGTILSTFVFITLTKFRSFDSKSGWKWCSCITFHPDPWCCNRPFLNLDSEEQKLYKESSLEVFLPSDPTDDDNKHTKVYAAANKENKLRDWFRTISMLMTFLLTLAAIVLLVIVVLKSANYQLDKTPDTEDGTGFANWVLPLCITFVAAPPVLALIIIFGFTGRIYDIIND
mmetsp:Transcript_52124/g.59055  ORF Transcript_52124/g.59055 Transcript_52124/m.59055 type:complete len:283 (+) Transcript_52124:31-879(+)